jgi:hypothetical protein
MSASADPRGVLHAEGIPWQPDSVLNQTDSDITLMMLSQNDISYVERSDDPWITPQTEVETNTTIPGTNINVTLWLKSYEISLLGCLDQYQVCNPSMPSDSGCTTLGGLLSAANQAYTTKVKQLVFNSEQTVTTSRFLNWPVDRSLYSNVDGRGGAALNGELRQRPSHTRLNLTLKACLSTIASMMTYQNIQTHLPPNQWQIEVSTWFATSLAKEQTAVIEWATTPKNLPSTGWHHTAPTLSLLRSQCYSQLVSRGAGYQNFSILGLIITVVFCGVIVILGLTIDMVVGWLLRENSRYKQVQWGLEETLALYKAAFQSHGLWQDGPERMKPSSASLGFE